MVEKALNVWFFHAEGAPFGELDGYPSQAVRGMRAALTAALAVALTDPYHDPRPWEPLNEGDPLNVGDEVRRVHLGFTVTAVVGRTDQEGDPWTAEDAFIGRRRYGTWYVRRAGLESDMP